MLDSVTSTHDRVVRSDRAMPLRIAILSYRSDPKVGGQGVYVDYLSKALVEAGASVDVISGPPYPELSKDVRLVKLPSLDLYAKPNFGHTALRPRHLLSATDTYEYFGHLSGKFVEPYTFGQRVYKYMKSAHRNYDVILDNQTLATGIFQTGAKRQPALTTTIHHPITRDRALALEAAPSWKHRLLVRRWYAFHRMQVRNARRLSMITCPSEHAKADIVTEFGVAPDRIHPIPLGVDQTTFHPCAETVRAPRRIITTASSDTPLKGLHILLDAYAQVLKAHSDAELVVIGKLRNGQARKRLKALNLESRVTFKSDLSREELAHEFRSATVAVTPSLYEGFGLPAAEAMSCGTPVIVTDGGALPEVAGDAGIIVQKADAMELARAISGLLGDVDAQKRLGQACLNRAKATFDWDAIAPLYLAFFEEAIAAQC